MAWTFVSQRRLSKTAPPVAIVDTVPKPATTKPKTRKVKVKPVPATKIRWGHWAKQNDAIMQGFGRIISASTLYPLAAIKKKRAADGAWLVKVGSDAALSLRSAWLVRCKGDGNDSVIRMIAAPATGQLAEGDLRAVVLRCADDAAAMPSAARLTGAVAFFLEHQHPAEQQQALAAGVDSFPKSWTTPLDMVAYQNLARKLTM